MRQVEQSCGAVQCWGGGVSKGTHSGAGGASRRLLLNEMWKRKGETKGARQDTGRGKPAGLIACADACSRSIAKKGEGEGECERKRRGDRGVGQRVDVKYACGAPGRKCPSREAPTNASGARDKITHHELLDRQHGVHTDSWAATAIQPLLPSRFSSGAFVCS